LKSKVMVLTAIDGVMLVLLGAFQICAA